MIGFAIPTWNRAEKLRACVESIAAQHPQSIVIADDASTDDTPQICEKLAWRHPCVKYVRFEDRQNFAGNYKRAVLAADTEYTWTFGDDDILVEGALPFMLSTVKNTQFDFYHASETVRTKKAEALCGTMFELCNTLGWLDFTGFISGNVVRTSLLQEGVNSPQWALYGTSSYPQALALLETLAGRTAMMMEAGVVQSSALGDADTVKRWADNAICWKYLYVSNGLKHLVQAGIVPPKVNETFFRYITESLFNRLMRDFNGREVLAPGEVTEGDWDCLEYLAGMVAGPRGEQILAWVQRVRAKIKEEQQYFIASQAAYGRLSAVMNTIEFPQFTEAYLP